MDNSDESHQDNLESDHLGHLQAIKAAIHLTVGQISEETGSEYGLTFSKPVIATVSEFINRQIEVYANDLEAFAKHARRTCIGCEDVKLLARRNPKLKECVKDLVDAVEASSSTVVKKGKKRKSCNKEEKKGEEEEEKEETNMEVIDIT